MVDDTHTHTHTHNHLSLLISVQTRSGWMAWPLSMWGPMSKRSGPEAHCTLSFNYDVNGLWICTSTHRT